VALYARGLTQVQIAVVEKNPASAPSQADPQARLALAVEDLEKCVQAEPVNLSYLVALATAHAMLEHFDRADKLLETALRVSPNDRNTRILKAKAEARQSFWPVPPKPSTAPSGGG